MHIDCLHSSKASKCIEEPCLAFQLWITCIHMAIFMIWFHCLILLM